MSGFDHIRCHAQAALRVLLPVVALCSAAGCSTTPEPAAQTGKLSDMFATPEWAKFTSSNAPVMRAVTPNDLITADGACAVPVQGTDGAAAPESADAALSGQGPLPGLQSGVGLGMTECEVVQRTGSPERFDIGAQGTERVVSMTVTRGASPGIYRFRSGRLVSIERIDVPAPSRSAKAKKPAQKSSQKQSSSLRGAQQ